MEDAVPNGASYTHLSVDPHNVLLPRVTECETCERESCYTDSEGRESCSTTYYDCNCVTYCDRYSTEKGTINCGFCHDFKSGEPANFSVPLIVMTIHRCASGYQFTVNNNTYYREQTMSCGLDGTTGLDHHACHAETMQNNKPGTTRECWVNKASACSTCCHFMMFEHKP